jgi:hypothetical protein
MLFLLIQSQTVMHHMPNATRVLTSKNIQKYRITAIDLPCQHLKRATNLRTCIHTYIHIGIRAYIFMYKYSICSIYIYIYIHIYIFTLLLGFVHSSEEGHRVLCIHTYMIHTHTSTHTHTQAYKHTYTYTHMTACLKATHCCGTSYMH